jgi:hypothetical protein
LEEGKRNLRFLALGAFGSYPKSSILERESTILDRSLLIPNHIIRLGKEGKGGSSLSKSGAFG